MTATEAMGGVIEKMLQSQNERFADVIADGQRIKAQREREHAREFSHQMWGRVFVVDREEKNLFVADAGDHDVLGVFSTREKAQEFIDGVADDAEYCYISEFTIDRPHLQSDAERRRARELGK